MTSLLVRAGVVLAMLAVKASSAASQAPSLEAARRALDAGDGATAVSMYEALTQQGESLEAEIGLVRAALLAGEFRKALSWATLTAGEHKDSAEAVALLAYLHDRVGHTEQAFASLKTLRDSHPSSAIAVAAQAEILKDRLAADQAATLLKTWRAKNPSASPQRAWPRPAFDRFPFAVEHIAAAGNGLIVDGGTRVLTYAAALPKAATFYVRNGLGKVRRAERTPNDQTGELVRLKLTEAYPSAWAFPEDEIVAPEGVRFCFAFGYATPRDTGGAYPAVSPGLVFRADAGVGGLMQITSPLGAGHSGSPVFDPRGRLIGVAVGAGNIVIDGESLRARLGDGNFAVRVRERVTTLQQPVAAKGPVGPMPSVEELYERVLPKVVQIVAVR
jgi:hypothetical protein